MSQSTFTATSAMLMILSTLPYLAYAADVPSTLSPVVPPQIILAPTEVRTDPTLAKGCWIRLFPEPGYKGADDLTIAGPLDLQSLHTPLGGVFWKKKAESMIAGPKATITVYENASYRGASATIQPGTRETRLREGLKLMHSIDSLKIRCER